MSTLLPAAIDGNETDLDSASPLAALSAFYRAFNNRDIEAMARNWHDEADASMSNPLGGIARGWTAIRAVYQRIFEGRARVHVAFHDYTLHVAGDMFYAVGRERGTLVRDGLRLEPAIRTSRLFRRIDGAWRQVHHHGSFDDAALLSAYQEAVR
ncbi:MULTISPECIES: YybH family protein [Rhodanobacter]|uniref:Nuclear transport factor 2 family protein n=1 Tax=Rhodanobacter hydrolyticus TaxID=2250595 RepID=A0ABW8J4Q7_9GAMM|nr:nuclear transport factor 2 family protein [Rhodanobacter sp. 7MK24]MBD8879038.1 nuclear transport factor 2 family protein [Rhodanobacter sp. 7MK24]